MPDQQAVHHTSGLHIKGLLWGTLGIAGGIVFALAVAWWTWSSLRPNVTPQPMRVPAPQLETAPQPERKAYEAEKARLINSIGWVDRQSGIARIPIDDAMQLVAARHGARK